VIGIVSEGDLMLRQKGRASRPWWRGFLEHGEELAREYKKRAGAVVCVSPRLPIESVAVILDERRIRRVPVVDLGRLVGIVSRGDLIRILASEPLRRAGAPPSERALEREFRDRLTAEPWAVSAHGLLAQASRDGVLTLWGLVDSRAEKEAVETLARTLEGVTRVESQVVVRQDAPYLYWA
jgi:hypothetical protein